MAITNPVIKLASGIATQTINVNKTFAVVAAGPTTTTLSLPQAVTNGVIRIKFSNPGSTDLTVAFTVTLTDGTGITTVYFIPTPGLPANSGGATSGIDLVIPFNTDLAVNSISVIDTVAGTTKTGTLDFEVVGNP